jgi:RNA polymerase sigma-70 factor, ECF subfamily
MLRVAGGYVGSTATAEEVVQETWLAVIRGLDKFEERSSLRTWVLRICVNQAKRHGVRESRIQPSGMPSADE